MWVRYIIFHKESIGGEFKEICKFNKYDTSQWRDLVIAKFSMKAKSNGLKKDVPRIARTQCPNDD